MNNQSGTWNKIHIVLDNIYISVLIITERERERERERNANKKQIYTAVKYSHMGNSVSTIV